MVAYAREEAQDTRHKAQDGYVCPKCFRKLYGSALGGEYDRYGRIMRNYFGWCLDCNYGFEVIQFKKENTKFGWLIHKYRLFRILEGSENSQPVTAWLVMNPLPETAPVVTGQGKEYDKPFTPALADPQTIELVETVLTALKATVKTVESLLKLAKLK